MLDNIVQITHDALRNVSGEHMLTMYNTIVQT